MGMGSRGERERGSGGARRVHTAALEAPGKLGLPVDLNQRVATRVLAAARVERIGEAADGIERLAVRAIIHAHRPRACLQPLVRRGLAAAANVDVRGVGNGLAGKLDHDVAGTESLAHRALERRRKREVLQVSLRNGRTSRCGRWSAKGAATVVVVVVVRFEFFHIRLDVGLDVVFIMSPGHWALAGSLGRQCA